MPEPMTDDLSPREELAATLTGLLAAGLGARPVALADALLKRGWRKPSTTLGLGTLRHRNAQPRPAEFRRVAQSTLDYIRDLEDMVAGRGAHAEHTQKQVGRCVVCSCKARAQGRLK